MLSISFLTCHVDTLITQQLDFKGLGLLFDSYVLRAFELSFLPQLFISSELVDE
jgi:hypothetical protein